MKTVRFAALVESGGRPDVHLLLVKPQADRALQKAIKAKKVVTIFQSSVGNKADHGEVGFRPGTSRQYLVFPRSVGAFDGRKVVGINYDLLEASPTPQIKRAEKVVLPPRKKTQFPEKRIKPREKSKQKANAETPVPDEKVVKFPEVSKEEAEEDEVPAVGKLKAQVRKAMDALEKGKQVAAFNLLKRIVGD